MFKPFRFTQDLRYNACPFLCCCKGDEADMLFQQNYDVIVIGGDIRLSSEDLKQATIRGLNDAAVS